MACLALLLYVRNILVETLYFFSSAAGELVVALLFLLCRSTPFSLSLDYLMISKILYNNGRPLSDRYLQLKINCSSLTQFPREIKKQDMDGWMRRPLVCDL